MPLPPPGRSSSSQQAGRSRRARRGSRPSSRSSSRAAPRGRPRRGRAGRPAPATSGASPACAASAEIVPGQPERVQERGRSPTDGDEQVDEATAARPSHAAVTSAPRHGVQRGLDLGDRQERRAATRSTCGAKSDPASTSRAGPSATTSPSPSTTTRVAHRAASSTSWVAITTAPPAAACACDRGLERGARRRVDAAGRLVEQQHRRPADRDRGDGDPLALAAREAARVAVGQRRQPEASSQCSTRRPGRARPSSRGVVSATSARTVGANSIDVRVLRHVRDRLRRVSMRPATGSARPASARSRVVLPEPLRPSSATTSPAWRSRSTPVSTVVDPWRDRHALRAPQPGPQSAGRCGRAGRSRRGDRWDGVSRRPRSAARSRTVSGGGSQPSSRPRWVTVGAPA